MINLKKEYREEIRKSIINKMNSYLLQACYDMNDVYTKREDKIQNNENIIRNVLLEEFLNDDIYRKKWDMCSYRFELESPENYDFKLKNHVGRSDIKVMRQDDYFENKEKYYIIECKRIDGRSTLNKKFVDEGVLRFMTSKYSSYYGQSTMIGFVVENGVDIEKNYFKIIDYQQILKINSIEIGSADKKNLSFNSTRYMKEAKLNIKYLFFDFSRVIL